MKNKSLVKQNQFLNKTIAKMDTQVVNELIFYFADGTTATLEVEAVHPSIGLYGIVSQE